MHEVKKIIVVIGLLAMTGLPSARAAENTTNDSDREDVGDPFLEELENSGVLQRFGLAWADTTTELSVLDDYLLIALRDNPRLRQRFAEYTAVEASVSQVSSLPDPKLSYTEYFQPVETRVGPQQRSFAFSQTFPWFGSLSAGGNINFEKAAAARALFENTALEIIAEVKQAYYELGYLERAVLVTEQHLQLLNQWEDVARVRYSAGKGQYTDVIKSQVELGVLSDRLAEIGDQRRPYGAELNALLNRGSATPVVVNDQPVPPENQFSFADLSDQMVAHNPLLTAWNHRAQSFLEADRFVQKQGAPSFTLGVNYIQTGDARMDGVAGSGTDAFMGTLAVTIPIWRGKYDAGSQVAISQYGAALSGKREMINDLNTALERAHFRYRDAWRKMALYESALLPKGRQSLGATRTAYEAGSSSFLDLVDAERIVLEFELSQVRAEFDVLIQESILEKIVAGPLGSQDKIVE